MICVDMRSMYLLPGYFCPCKFRLERLAEDWLWFANTVSFVKLCLIANFDEGSALFLNPVTKRITTAQHQSTAQTAQTEPSNHGKGRQKRSRFSLSAETL